MKRIAFCYDSDFWRFGYDCCDQIAEKQIYPRLGDDLVGDIVAADIKKLLNYWMNKAYSYSTVFMD